MFSSKSKRLIQHLTGGRMHGIPTIGYKPTVDTRSDDIVSREGFCFPAKEIESVREIPYPEVRTIIGIDEAQFLDRRELIEMAKSYLISENWLILAGLTYDSDRQCMGGLFDVSSLSSKVFIESCEAICEMCRGTATDTFCKVQKDDQVMVGSGMYGPRCRACHTFG